MKQNYKLEVYELQITNDKLQIMSNKFSHYKSMNYKCTHDSILLEIYGQW